MALSKRKRVEGPIDFAHDRLSTNLLAGTGNFLSMAFYTYILRLSNGQFYVGS